LGKFPVLILKKVLKILSKFVSFYSNFQTAELTFEFKMIPLKDLPNKSCLILYSILSSV